MKFQWSHKNRLVIISMCSLAFFAFAIWMRLALDSKEQVVVFEEYGYNYQEQKIEKYEKSEKEQTHQSVGYWNEVDNEFQYFFKEYDPIVTSGNSTTNQFSLLEVHPTNITNRLQWNDEQTAIFPLTKDQEGQLYFSVVTYQENGEEDSRVVHKYDQTSNQLLNMKIELDGLLGACIVENQMYLTAYNQETDAYDLYQVSLETDATPSLVQENIGTYEIYQLQEALYLKTNQNELKAYHSEKSYPAGETTVVYGDYLIHLNAENDQTQELQVYSISKDKSVYQMNHVRHFYIEGDKLSVYTAENQPVFHLSST